MRSLDDRGSFPRSARVRRKSDFDRIFRTGTRVSARLLLLVARRNELGQARLGISASKRLGGAVVRNEFKRRVRELFRRDPRLRACSFDLVVHGHPAAASATFANLARDLQRGTEKLCRDLRLC